MSNNKFKVGDRVRVKKLYPQYDCSTNLKIGDEGVIRVCSDTDSVIRVDFGEKFKLFGYSGNYNSKNNAYAMYKDQVELINDEKIIIYRDGNQVIALNKLTGKKGIRKCNPADTFDFNIGAKLAFERLTANVTFKMLCIESDNYFVTKGKTYEFVNGVTTYDTGHDSVKYKNFAEYARCNLGFARFVIELKDGDDPDEILKKHDSTIRVGDTVEIVDKGFNYSTYSEWVVKHVSSPDDIVNYSYNQSPGNGLKCTVVRVAKHERDDKMLAYVKAIGFEKCFLINVKGLKKI